MEDVMMWTTALEKTPHKTFIVKQLELVLYQFFFNLFNTKRVQYKTCNSLRKNQHNKHKCNCKNTKAHDKKNQTILITCVILQWEGVNLVQMGWSVFEDLLCAAEDGTVYVYTIHGDFKRMITTGKVNDFLILQYALLQ